MGRRIEEAADYPDFFRHAFKKRLELRQRLLKRNSIQCSLSAMLDCNQKKFLMKFSLWRTTSVRSWEALPLLQNWYSHSPAAIVTQGLPVATYAYECTVSRNLCKKC